MFFYKKYVIKKIQVFGVFFKLARHMCNQLDYNSIKNYSKTPYFLQKIVVFFIFEPNNCEVKENHSKAPHSVSPLKSTYLGKKSFQYH